MESNNTTSTKQVSSSSTTSQKPPVPHNKPAGLKQRSLMRSNSSHNNAAASTSSPQRVISNITQPISSFISAVREGTGMRRSFRGWARSGLSTGSLGGKSSSLLNLSSGHHSNGPLSDSASYASVSGRSSSRLQQHNSSKMSTLSSSSGGLVELRRHQQPSAIGTRFWLYLTNNYQYVIPHDWIRNTPWLQDDNMKRPDSRTPPGHQNGGASTSSSQETLSQQNVEALHAKRLNNPLCPLRFTQVNETLQLSPSLPTTFLVPRQVSEMVLLEAMAVIVDGQQVPTVSYQFINIIGNPHFLLRSGPISPEKAFKMEQVLKVGTAGGGTISSVETLHLSVVVPSEVDVSKAYYVKLLRVLDMRRFAVVRPPFHRHSTDFGLSSSQIHHNNNTLLSNGNHNHQSATNKQIFNITTGAESGLQVDGEKLLTKLKWLQHVATCLRIGSSLATRITYQSLLVTGKQHWASLACSLAQIILDSRNRTIPGFLALISREWIYSNGLANSSTSSLRLSTESFDLVFHLFLDCVYQLMITNPSGFQFSTLFLLHLSDELFASQDGTSSSKSANATHEAEQLWLTIELWKHKTSRTSEAEDAKSEDLQIGPTKRHATQEEINAQLPLYNPFFRLRDHLTTYQADRLRVPGSVMELTLWRSNYMRCPSVGSKMINQNLMRPVVIQRNSSTSCSNTKQENNGNSGEHPERGKRKVVTPQPPPLGGCHVTPAERMYLNAIADRLADAEDDQSRYGTLI